MKSPPLTFDQMQSGVRSGNLVTGDCRERNRLSSPDIVILHAQNIDSVCE